MGQSAYRSISYLAQAELAEIRRDWMNKTEKELSRAFKVWPSSMALHIKNLLNEEKHRQRQLKDARAKAVASSRGYLGYFENCYTASSLIGEERQILRKGPLYSLYD